VRSVVYALAVPSGKKSREARKRKGAVPKPPTSSRGTPSRTWWLAGAGAAVLVVIAVVLAVTLGGKSNSGSGGCPSGSCASLSTLGKLVSPGPLGPEGPEGPPLSAGIELAPAASISPGGEIDGIECQPLEQVLFHIHARLTIFVRGRPMRVPYGIGISSPEAEGTPAGAFVVAGKCFSWLHTHAADGVIHIESPVQRTYTLGDFFDIWHQPLSRTRVGPAQGHVTALFNGKVWTANVRSIPLYAHAQIQLEVGRPLVGPVHISNWNGL
jgi:hypothetical protein